MNLIFKFRLSVMNLCPSIVAVFCLAATAANARDTYVPDYYMVTATAGYRPVSVPGTQRRVAQNDAELKARRQIQEYVGSMPVTLGRTVNDVITRDARLKAKILELIRTSEVVDWHVNPACACVQVWVRIDLNQVRAIIASCGYIERAVAPGVRTH